MSGHSDSTECPNCGASCDEYSDWKPFNYTVITCLECGLVIAPTVQYMTLKELNNRREESELPKLKKKPKQDKDVW